MKKFIFLGLSLGTALTLMGIAKTSYADNLQGAVAQALASHPTIKRADLGRDIADEAILEEQSAYFPTVSASVAGGRLYADNATSRGLSVTRGAGYSWLWEGNASLNQTIFSWNERGNRVDSAKAQRLSAFHTLEDARQTIAYRAVQAYIALYRAQELHKEATHNLAAMQDYKTRIGKLVAGGGADASEESRAGDVVLAAENILAELKGQLVAAQASYIEVVGHAPKTALERPPMPFVINSDAQLDALIEKIRNAHPQVKALRQNVESLEYAALAESKDPLPDLGSELSYTKRDQRDLIGGESTDARAMLRLSWNLDTGGAQFARSRRASLQHEEALAELEELQRTIERNLRVSLAGLEVAREQRDIQKKRHGELTATLETYKQQFDASKKRLVEVMLAESQTFLAYNDFLNSEFTMLDAAYGFLTSQGHITDAIDILTLMESQDDMTMIDDISAITPAAGQVVEVPVEQVIAAQEDIQSHEFEEIKNVSKVAFSSAAEEEMQEKELAIIAQEKAQMQPIFSAEDKAALQEISQNSDIEAKENAKVASIENETEIVQEAPVSEAASEPMLELAPYTEKTVDFVPFRTSVRAAKESEE
jgi:adhesin transport system outer membrane protein